MSDIDIKVVGEDDPSIITYSRALVVSLSALCKNRCAFCGYNKRDNLIVPYSTIKQIKIARTQNIREAYYISGERPDLFPHIRSILDLWGFGSFLDYLYTVCELGFLEGLIPVVDVGFLTPEELIKISEVTAVIRIMLDGVDQNKWETIYKESPGKRLEIRLKSLEWAAKLQIPTSTGIIVGLGESFSFREDILKEIAKLHENNGNIIEVTLQNYQPNQKAPLNIEPPSKEEMLKTVARAFEILPADIRINVPFECNPNIEDFIKLGIRDLGRLFEPTNKYFYSLSGNDFQQLEVKLQNLGFSLQQRFPLGLEFIKSGKYSKKLGQIFEAYRYKIKKEDQDKLKELNKIGN